MGLVRRRNGVAMIEIDPNKIYTVAGVVAWLQHEKPWFYRHRAQLERLGFPKPLNIPGRSRWRGDELIAWSKRRDELQAALDAPGSNIHSLAKIARERSAAMSGRRRAS